MKFFGVHIEDLESERFLSASNDQIATWLFLHALCSKQLNGGTITDAAALTDRFWSRHGIVKSILDAPSPLWSWDGDSLAVEPYDIAGQTVFEAKVKGGKTRARQRWGSTPESSPDRSPNRSANRPEITLPEITHPILALNGESSHPSPKKSKSKGTLDELKAFAVEIGMPADDGEDCFDRWQGSGWKNGGKAIADWQATMRTWKRRGFLASQQTKGGAPPAPAGTIIAGGRAMRS